MTDRPAQPALFDPGPRRIKPAEPRPEDLQLAAALPSQVRLGAMTWSYRGWIGRVYGQECSEQDLARHGLSAYVQHPLLTLAELDRTYYEPLSAAVYRGYAEQVPAQFRFLVKAHELCTVQRFPLHPRYGQKRGQDNPLYLDAGYAARSVVEPAAEGLGDKLLAVLWQFSPQDARDPRGFAEQLHGFLRGLPTGCRHAVELRTRDLLGPDYAAAIADTGALHCYNAWTAMPSVLAQARSTPPSARRPLIVRWLLRPGEKYEDARQRYEPFDRLVAEDLDSRSEIATLVAKAYAHDVESFILVDNKAEGSAPESISRLGHAIATQLAVARP
ncbi:MAG: DUF72 domain-containing protein [Polyangiales bacterium]